MYTKTLQVNQQIHSILYGGRDGYITKIVGEQTPETIETLYDGVGVMGGSADIHIRFCNGTETNVPECIVRGVQWHIGEVLSPEELIEYDNEYFESKEQNTRNYIAKEEKKESDKIFLSKKYGKILVAGNDQKTAIQNIRIELKQNFPSVKFSVTKDGYNSINIRWTDGPKTDEVEKIVDKYEDSETDETGDFRDYNPSEFNKLFGGVKICFTNRHMSEETEKILNTWAESIFTSDGYNDNYNCWNHEQLAHKLFCGNSINGKIIEVKHKDVDCGICDINTFYEIISEVENKKIDNVQNVLNSDLNNVQNINAINTNSEIVQTDIQLIDYSDKCIVITGNTKPIKESLKDLGGKFNAHLKCGAGWVFPKKKENEIRSSLSL